MSIFNGWRPAPPRPILPDDACAYGRVVGRQMFGLRATMADALTLCVRQGWISQQSEQAKRAFSLGFERGWMRRYRLNDEAQR